MTNNQNVLVYQIGSLGDTIVSIPAYRAIRRHFGPKAFIRVLHNVPVGQRATPNDVLASTGLIDANVAYTQYSNQLQTSFALWAQIRKAKPDVIVYVLPGQRTPASVIRDFNFFRFCGVKSLFGFKPADQPQFSRRPNAGEPFPCKHESTIRLDRLEDQGISVLSEDCATPLINLKETQQLAARQWLSDHGALPGRPLVALAPGANQSAKFWPLERFAEIIVKLERAGYDTVLIGSKQEESAASFISLRVKTVIDAVGKNTVMETAAIISQAKLFIGLDTGTTHLASAVGTPTIVLFADRNAPGQWEPMGNKNTIIRHVVPCGGCGLSVCTVPGHPCMTTISVGEVWDSICAHEALLSKE